MNFNKVAILLFCQNWRCFNTEAKVEKGVDEFHLNSVILRIIYYFQSRLSLKEIEIAQDGQTFILNRLNFSFKFSAPANYFCW